MSARSAAALLAVVAASCAARMHPPLPSPSVPLTRTPEQSFRAAAPRAAAARPFVPPSIESFALANGLTVYVVSQPQHPVLVATLVARDGGDDDVGVPEGLAALAARAALAASERADLPLDADVTPDAATFRTRGLATDLAPAIAMLASVASRPAIDPRSFARAQATQLDAIHGANTRRTALELATLALYGRGHPYARALDGTRESTRQLGLAEVTRFLRERYVPSRSALIVVGDVTRDAVAAEAERAFAGWPSRAPAPRTRPAVRSRRTTPRAHLIMSGDPIARLLIAQDAVAPNAPDYYALLLGTKLLGGTLSSRLAQRLRAREGWTYVATANLVSHADGGTLVVETAVPLERVGDALRALREEMQRLVDEPMLSSELATARALVLADLAAQFETDAGTEAAVARLFVDALPADTYAQAEADVADVRASDVRLVSRDCLDANDAETVVVADPSVVPQIESAGFADVATYRYR